MTKLNYLDDIYLFNTEALFLEVQKNERAWAVF